MSKQSVHSPAAPAAIGPYSPAIRVGELLFCSGQVPLDPATGELVPGDIAAQTNQSLRNMKAVLEAAGATMDQVVKTTIFLVDMGDFAKVNEVYGKFFSTTPPARSTVQVSALPKGARVEVEAIAHLGA